MTCLFAGSVEHLMRDLFTNRRRALYGFGGFHELSPITPGEWQHGLEKRFAKDDVHAYADALERIVTSGRSHPRCTMLIAQQAHVALVEADAHQLDLAGAERGYRGAMGRRTRGTPTRYSTSGASVRPP